MLQWQWVTRRGGTAASKLTAPHRQAPLMLINIPQTTDDAAYSSEIEVIVTFHGGSNLFAKLATNP